MSTSINYLRRVAEDIYRDQASSPDVLVRELAFVVRELIDIVKVLMPEEDQ